MYILNIEKTSLSILYTLLVKFRNEKLNYENI